MTLDGVGRAPVVFAGASLVGFGLLEVLRIWFPSVLFVLGDAGRTPAPLIAAVGLVCLGLAPVFGCLIGRVGPASLWLAGAGALVLGRGALIFGLPGAGRLLAASVAVVGATTAVVALAAGPTDRPARVGLLAGIVAATCVHAGTRTLGLIWPGTITTVVVSVALVISLAIVTGRTGRALPAASERPDETPRALPGAPAWPWFALTPLLLLTGVVSGVPGRTAVATGWPAPTVAATVAGAQLAALVAALLAPRLGPARAGVLAAAAVSGGTAAALDAAGWSGVLGQITLSIGLGLLAGSDLGGIRPGATDRRRGVVAGLAVLSFGALAASYYAAYDLVLPINNRLLLLGTALMGSVLAIAMARVGRSAAVPLKLAPGRLGRLAGTAGLVVALVAAIARPPASAPAAEVDAAQIRVATFNVRSGFDLDGRFAAREQGALLREHAPDVVVLNEVDRGWLTSGGHDALEIIAAELGLPHVLFSPAADEVWGNALLSRFPIGESASEVLPRGNDPMGRGQLAAVLLLDDGQRIGVIGTHLSRIDDQGATRLPQARAVAATVAILRERQAPTLVLGDLNAEPGSPELRPFASLVDDVLPRGTLTYPSDEPTLRLDHLLVSPDLRRTKVILPETTLSDHRPVMADVAVRDP